jgi:tRNA A37 N6-isopentenylltransferase MiaA
MGPSVVGKTAVVIDLARKFNGCVIAADSFHYYDKIGLGSWKEHEAAFNGIPRLLYGILPLDSPIISYDEFYHNAEKARREAISGGFTPLFEGCHSGFARHLAGAKNPPASEHGLIGVVVLMPYGINAQKKIKDKVRQRLERYVQLGIVKEVKNLIESGYSDTVPMRSLLYKHFGDHINGKIDLHSAIESTYTDWLNCVDKQIVQFQTVKNSFRLPVDLDNPEATLDDLVEFISLNLR